VKFGTFSRGTAVQPHYRFKCGLCSTLFTDRIPLGAGAPHTASRLYGLTQSGISSRIGKRNSAPRPAGWTRRPLQRTTRRERRHARRSPGVTAHTSQWLCAKMRSGLSSRMLSVSMRCSGSPACSHPSLRDQCHRYERICRKRVRSICAAIVSTEGHHTHASAPTQELAGIEGAHNFGCTR